VEVEFIVTDDEAKLLLELLLREKVTVFYALVPARFGMLSSGTAAD
jgi:hypothetical protein